MKSNPAFHVDLTDEQRERIRQIEYDFHVRVFGEEMARVNFLPKEERMAYLYDIMDHARRKGVCSEPPSPGYTR